MTKICIILILCFSIKSLYSQVDLKEVKTAQDIIDNYISAVGGADKLNGIRSETVWGTLSGPGFGGNFITYRDDTMTVSKAEGNINDKEMLMLKSVTSKDLAWEYQMGAMKDFTGEELESKEENRIIGSLHFYSGYEKYGYVAESEGTENVNGKECYKITFTKSGNLFRTVFFDTKTFYILRSERPEGMILEYNDFKDVNGIIKPFTITQITHAKVDQLVKEYKFNEPVDQSLLMKPAKD
ncbi:MAG: hypothetical protein ABI462_03910 [Ignavibacteria bacterium]